MPVLRPSAIGGQQDRRAPRKAPAAHHDTAHVVGHRCVVNGPDEARETDIGFTGCGNVIHQVYIGGLTDHRLKDADIVDRERAREKGRGDRGREAKGKELAAAQ